jgi:haloalkane dehalogenase
MSTMILKVIAPVLIFGLVGCKSVDDKAFFTQYVKTYQENNPQLTKTIARDDGYKINVREFGIANKGNGPTVVMMHGFPDSQYLYDPLIAKLYKTRHVITFDYVGWGNSDKPAKHTYNVASLRKDLDTVMASYQLASVQMVVHDLSGQPGIEWVLENEAKTHSLVLLNTYYSPMENLIAPEAIARFSTPGVKREISILFTNLSDNFWQNGVKEQLSKFFTNEEARDIYIKIFAHQALGIRPAFLGENKVLWDEIEQRRAMAPTLKQFKKPVLIIFGEDDPYLNKGVAKEFHGLFATSQLFLINGASHYVQLDKPDEVAEIMLNIVDQ